MPPHLISRHDHLLCHKLPPNIYILTFPVDESILVKKSRFFFSGDKGGSPAKTKTTPEIQNLKSFFVRLFISNFKALIAFEKSLRSKVSKIEYEYQKRRKRKNQRGA
jgi:hypothetical protein